MQKFAKFINLNYIAGSAPHVVQGIKNGRTPYNAIKGGNGSFRVAGEPSKLILTVKTTSGQYVSFNIISTVRAVLNRERITEKLRDKLENAFSSSNIEVSNGYITNLKEIIEKI